MYAASLKESSVVYLGNKKEKQCLLCIVVKPDRAIDHLLLLVFTLVCSILYPPFWFKNVVAKHCMFCFELHLREKTNFIIGGQIVDGITTALVYRYSVPITIA